MTRTWTLGDLEFVVRWGRLREDGLPSPFSYTTEIPWEDEFQRECVRLRDRLLAAPDPALEDALVDIARPDIAIRVRGVGADPADPTTGIRLLAARRQDRGYLLTQLPGRTVEHSGGFTLQECDPLRLAERVTDALPAEEAGQLRGLSLPGAPEQETEANASRLWDSFDEPDDAQADRFLRTAPHRYGVIEILQGISRFGPRGRTIRVLHWRDHPDDGRYLVVPGPQPVAEGVDRTRMVGAINAEIVVVVRAIKDERV